MIILGIETSCDETSIALLEATNKKGNFLIHPLQGIVSSQIKIHAPYGGVVPMLASREHAKNLEIVFKETILPVFGSIDNFKQKLDLIAVTQGPGLIPALLMGVNFSKTLAWAWQKPIVGVNHLEGHLLSFLLPKKAENSQLSITHHQNVFPAIGLLVSGGHTQLIYIKNIGQYQILGETRDDAAGECFDKGARILGLGYPGGPSVAKMATKFKIQNSKIKIPKLPRPMLNSPDYDFSFSGLKTALLYSWQKIEAQTKKKLLPGMAYELQEAITDVLVFKTLKAAQDYSVKSIILGGGVTANQRLKEKFQEQLKKQTKTFNFYLPLLEYTTDNAMMVALAGFFDYFLKTTKERKNLTWINIMAEANLRV
jgi:N6-L-threonylcarbamoyladenine synthase